MSAPTPTDQLTDQQRQDEIDVLEGLLEPWSNPLHRQFDPGDDRWQALPVDVRMAFMHAAQRLNILLIGFTMVGVFPTVDQPGHHFAYTAGQSCSYLLVGASSGATVEYLLTLCAENGDQHADGQPFDVGQSGYQAVLAPVPDQAFREHCTGAISFGATHARQVIIQDDQHRWPWDPDTKFDVPILAGPEWRP